MAIRHKRKSVSDYTWLSTDLVDGQIGVNSADGTVHVLKTDNTVKTIGVQEYSVSTTNDISVDIISLPITLNSAMKFTANVVGYSTTNGNSYAAVIEGAVKDVASTSSIIGATNTIEFDNSVGQWLVTALVVGNTLRIRVNGQAATNINWKATITKVEV